MNSKWAIVVPLVAISLAGCLDADDSTVPERNVSLGTMEWIDDSHQNGGPRGYLPDAVNGMEYIATGSINGTTGVWVNDDIAYLSGSAGLRIVDVHDPANPILLAADVPETASRDVDVLKHSNGRMYATLSAGGVALVDVTDLDNVYMVSKASVSSHNHAVVPGTDIVYNSRSISTHGAGTEGGVTTGRIDIIDFTVPELPVVTTFDFPAVIQDSLGVPHPVAATTCHDITFAPERNLAFCPGISETHIWDISDPFNPVIVQVIDFPLVQIHHGAWAAQEGNMLILGDEHGGAAAGVCTVPQNPYATLWFFDITNLATPTPMGYFTVNYNSVTDDEDIVSDIQERNPDLCTTHFGTIVEDRDMMVMGWYTAGVVLIDFSDPLQPRQVDHFRPAGDMNTWEARYYKGHVYTGDTVRGMDILEII